MRKPNAVSGELFVCDEPLAPCSELEVRFMRSSQGEFIQYKGTHGQFDDLVLALTQVHVDKPSSGYDVAFATLWNCNPWGVFVWDDPAAPRPSFYISPEYIEGIADEKERSRWGSYAESALLPGFGGIKLKKKADLSKEETQAVLDLRATQAAKLSAFHCDAALRPSESRASEKP